MHLEVCKKAEICPECGEENSKRSYNGNYSFNICVNKHESNRSYNHDDE